MYGRRAYMFNFDHQFEIHDDVEVLRRMGMTYSLELGRFSADDRCTLLSTTPDSIRRIIMGAYSSVFIIHASHITTGMDKACSSVVL